MTAAELEAAVETLADQAIALYSEISNNDALQEKVGEKMSELYRLRQDATNALDGYQNGTKTLDELEAAYTALLTCYNEVETLKNAQ